MDISVVIPTFNRENLVGRAIRSVLDQSYPVHEVIVVDDGSTDNSISDIKRNFPGIIVIDQHNQGVSNARNTGIRSATGSWIAFLDSDDEWKNNKLARQADALKRSPQFQVCHTDEIWIRNGKRVNPMKKHAKPNGWIFEQCLALCCVSPSSVLIKKELVESAGLFDESLPACEDYDLWLKIFAHAPVLLVAEKLLVKYGGHEDQLSRKFWGMDRFRVQALIGLLENDRLNERNRQCALETLLRKIEILIKGFNNRGNSGEVHRYQALYDCWSGRVC